MKVNLCVVLRSKAQLSQSQRPSWFLSNSGSQRFVGKHSARSLCDVQCVKQMFLCIYHAASLEVPSARISPAQPCHWVI